MVVEEPNAKNKIAKSKSTPIAGLFIIVLISYVAIPDTLAYYYKYLFSLIGGLLTVTFSLWTFIVWTPKVANKYPYIIGLISTSALFLFAYLFISNANSFASSELENYGVATNSIILTKSKIYSRNTLIPTLNYISIRFSTKNNKTVSTEIETSVEQHDSYKEGMSLPIYYSSRNPTVLKIAEEDNP